MAGLLLVLRGQVGTRARVLGMAHGFVAYGVGLSWLVELFGIFAPVLWCVLGVFHALFAEMMSRAEQRGWEGWRLALFAAVNWGAWEFVRAELFPLKFPWLTVGMAIGPNAMLPWVGVYVAGMILVFATALACVRAWRPALALGLGILAAVIVFSPVPEPAAEDPGGGEWAMDVCCRDLRSVDGDRSTRACACAVGGDGAGDLGREGEAGDGSDDLHALRLVDALVGSWGGRCIMGDTFFAGAKKG
jgi:hypothetical protein